MKKASVEASKEQLVADFKKVVADAEELLKATAKHGGEELHDVRARAEESIRAVKARLTEEGVELMDRTKHAAKATDAYIHKNPWQAIGIAAGVGLVVGLLTGRR
ncbi:MAG: DUF883 family protein [Thiohalomonadaceae bacterium]